MCNLGWVLGAGRWRTALDWHWPGTDTGLALIKWAGWLGRIGADFGFDLGRTDWWVELEPRQTVNTHTLSLSLSLSLTLYPVLQSAPSLQ